MKTEVDKLDLKKLVLVPVDLSKQSDEIRNDLVKKAVYDKLAAKVNIIDTNDFVLKTKAELENKIPDVSNLTTTNGKQNTLR